MVDSRDAALHVVIVDDDCDDQSFLIDAFKRQNVDTQFTVVSNGQELLDYLQQGNEQSPDSKRVPDVIILDLKMPVKDGYSTLDDLKGDEVLMSIPVMIFSGSMLTSANAKSLGARYTKMFAKPMALAEYDEIVTSIIALLPKTPRL